VVSARFRPEVWLFSVSYVKSEEQFREQVTRLHAVNREIAKLDPAIRASAFALLEPYIAEVGNIGLSAERKSASAGQKAARQSARPRRQASELPVVSATEGEEALLEAHLSDADHENAMLALAILYSRHGRGPYQLAHISAVAKQFHLNVPVRLDMSFKKAKRGDQNALVLRRQADGWKIMPSGETWLKATYGVSLGRSPLPA
jgi:hypothetical protein